MTVLINKEKSGGGLTADDEYERVNGKKLTAAQKRKKTKKQTANQVVKKPNKDDLDLMKAKRLARANLEVHACLILYYLLYLLLHSFVPCSKRAFKQITGVLGYVCLDHSASFNCQSLTPTNSSFHTLFDKGDN